MLLNQNYRFIYCFSQTNCELIYGKWEFSTSASACAMLNLFEISMYDFTLFDKVLSRKMIITRGYHNNYTAYNCYKKQYQ